MSEMMVLGFENEMEADRFGLKLAELQKDWGMLFGLLFFMPFLGMAIGAGLGALFGKGARLALTSRCSSRCTTPCRRARPAGSSSSPR